MTVLIAGGGVAALETALALRAIGGPSIAIVLLAPTDAFVDRPGSVAVGFGFGAAAPLDLRAVARREGLTLRQGTLAEVRPDRHVVLTEEGALMSYDALVIATGAGWGQAIPGAVTFSGPRDVPALERVMGRMATGDARRLVFAVPDGVRWSLPLYELATMAGVALRASGGNGDRITVVTPEPQPLWLFGSVAGGPLARMLTERGVGLRTNARPAAVEEGGLLLADGETIAADAVVALGMPTGPWIAGLPNDARGFLPVDLHGRVAGAADVYAAGDVTAFPVKQGGLATQQADAAAEAVAASMGALEDPAPFRPVLRGVMLTGGAPLYLRAELSPTGDVLSAGGVRGGVLGETSTRALWWPPAKVAGRYLAPYRATARPVGLSQEPLRDRTPMAAARPAADDEAFRLAMLIAEEDARIGDLQHALQAVDAAAALHGGVLPTDVATRRAEWAASCGGRGAGDGTTSRRADT